MEYRKLKEVCDIIGGFAFKSNEFKEEGIPVIRIGDIVGEGVKVSAKTIHVSKVTEKQSKYKIEKGNILIALSGATTGKYGIYNSEEVAYLNQRVAKITAKSGMNVRYIYHYLKVLQDRIFSKAAGCAQPNISVSELGEFEILVLSSGDEKKIIEILDEAKTLTEKRKEQIKALDELVKSKFYGEVC